MLGAALLYMRTGRHRPFKLPTVLSDGAPNYILITRQTVRIDN
jgi:hypothetical protein